MTGREADTQTPSIFSRRESGVRSYSRSYDAVFDTASGSVLRDARGVEYIDFLAGAGSLNYGHNDPDLRRALIEYLEGDGVVHGLDLHTSAKADFLETFERVILKPRGLDYRVQFTGPTGTNAVEAALKLARKVTGRSNVVAFTNAFHGVSQGALSATANSHHRMADTHTHTGVSRFPYDGYLGEDRDTADALEAMLTDTSSGVDAPAAVLLEVVQGEGGLNTASQPWLHRVADIARRAGALLIVDDIQAGCGRTGTFFSFEQAGIVPDIVTLSKSISGYGLPMALVLLQPALDVWEPGEHNGTFRGHQPAFVTARAALEKFWATDELTKDVARRASIVRSALDQTAARLEGARVKGRGLMTGLDVRDGELAEQIKELCFANHLIVETAGPSDEVLKIFAPLTTPDALLSEGLAVLDAAVADSAPTPSLVA